MCGYDFIHGSDVVKVKELLGSDLYEMCLLTSNIINKMHMDDRVINKAHELMDKMPQEVDKWFKYCDKIRWIASYIAVIKYKN